MHKGIVFTVFFAAASVLWARCLMAENAPKAFWNLGEGNASCGEFLVELDGERRARPPTARPTQIYNPGYGKYAYYADGFLTGANIWDFAHPMVGKTSEVPARMIWLENWCRANPLEFWTTALIALRVYLRDNGK